jgi:hypothetical protein
MIKIHCPNLAHGADAQLQCVPDSTARWGLHCDMRDFDVRGLNLRAIFVVTSSSERDNSGFKCRHITSVSAGRAITSAYEDVDIQSTSVEW